MAKGDALPDQDEVTRWVKPKLLGRDDDDRVILDRHGGPKFVFPTAFELRDDEDSLSVTWLQCFGERRSGHLPKAAEAFRRSTPSGKLQLKSAFAIAAVGAMKNAGGEFDHKLRVLEDPEDHNPGHSEVRRYPREMGEFQTLLAVKVFAERYLYEKVKAPDWTPRTA